MNWSHFNLYDDILFLKVGHLILLLKFNPLKSKWITEIASVFVDLGISKRHARYEIAPLIMTVKIHVFLEGIWAFLRLTSSNDTEVLWLPYV